MEQRAGIRKIAQNQHDIQPDSARAASKKPRSGGTSSGGLAPYTLKLPKIPKLEMPENSIFSVIRNWLGNSRVKYEGRNSNAILHFFNYKFGNIAGHYTAMIENVDEAFARIDCGGWEPPPDDLHGVWFCISFVSPSIKYVHGKPGKSYDAARRMLDLYSIVPVLDTPMVKELKLLCYDLDGLKLPPIPDGGELTGLPWITLKSSFRKFMELKENYDTVEHSTDLTFIPAYVICCAPPDEPDPMIDAFDRIDDDLMNSYGHSDPGFFQISADTRISDPDTFLELVETLAENLQAQDQAVKLLEAVS